MTNEDRKAKIAELRAEADRLEREGSIKDGAKSGDLFRSYGRIVLIPPSYPNTYALALTGESIGCQCYGWAEDPSLEYLGHARDLLTIKTPDAAGVDVGAGYIAIPWQNAGEGDEYMIDGKWWKSGGGSTHPRSPGAYSWRRKADTPEPTGAELVGKVCEFSDDGKTWIRGKCEKFDAKDCSWPYLEKSGEWYKFARLAKKQP